MRAELADGSVQEGVLRGDGGKLTDPAESHSFVVGIEGLVNLCTGRRTSLTVDRIEPRSIVYQFDFSEFGELSEFTGPEGC